MNLKLFIIENTVNNVKLRQYAKIHIAFVLQSCKIIVTFLNLQYKIVLLIKTSRIGKNKSIAH